MIPYDPRLALDLAEHAIAIYRGSNGYDRWARERGFVGADIVDRGATQIGVAYSEDRIVIAARGSSQLGDWLNNFTPFRVRWITPGRIHLGFRTQIARVADELVETVKELRQRYPRAVVQITGHSLGGAMASLIRALLVGCCTDVVVYTFESPRVGNSGWSEWYDALYGPTSFRVANINADEQDIVTRVPLSKFGWRHVGRPIMLCAGRAYESETAWEEHRRQTAVGVISHLRIARRAWLSVEAHFGAYLLDELRREVSG